MGQNSTWMKVRKGTKGAASFGFNSLAVGNKLSMTIFRHPLNVKRVLKDKANLVEVD